MNRKAHIIGGALFWAIVIGFYYWFGELLTEYSIWIMLSFFSSQFGAQLPDYDILWKKALPHRNILTHSFILPALLTIPIYFITTEMVFLLPIFALYLIGHASHLFLDLFPKGWEGSALVHLWWRNEKGRKTMNGTASFMFLLTNGLIILAGGIIFLFFFAQWAALI
ncbi:hypothetical protein ES705_07916 [subsurface metagenome]